MDAPKTSVIAKMLKKMGLEGKSTLIATADHSPMVYKSARNVQRVSKCCRSSDLECVWRF